MFQILLHILIFLLPVPAEIILSSTGIEPTIPVYRKEVKSSINSAELNRILTERKASRFVLGRSKKGREVEAYYFPGASNLRALVIGGMHGSELSSIEVARELLKRLQGDSVFYEVIVIPTLFPDNAELARQFRASIGDVKNIGRYSYPGAIDPNRQMPIPGKAFCETPGLDHAGRPIEMENKFLLDLIQQFRPHRIANLHAIRNAACAGVFADPRTDHQSIALGYESDSNLAITLAKSIHERGGLVPGNKLDSAPTALYHKDPPPAPAGLFQKRNFIGSPTPGHRGGGVSIGTWASTAVVDEANPEKNRDAIRILTIEFPGSKRPCDYQGPNRTFCQKQVEAYAESIKQIFLGEYFPENNL